MPVATLRSFSGGEIAPSLHARVDTAKYQTGLKTEENFVTMKHGGVVRRPGTQYIDHCHNGDYMVRLIPFAGTDDKSYILEIGHYYMRVIDPGEAVSGVTIQDERIEAMSHRYPGEGIDSWGSAILSIGSDLTVQIFETGSSFVFRPKSDTYHGDSIRITGAAGTNNVNGRTFRVYSTVPAAGTMRLKDLEDNFVTLSGSYTGGGYVVKKVMLRTPWASGTTRDASDIFNIRYTQSHGKMYLSCDNYPIMEIERGESGKWYVRRFEAGESTVPQLAETSYGYTNVSPYTIVPPYRLVDEVYRPRYLDSAWRYATETSKVIRFGRSVLPQGFKMASLRDTNEEHRRYAVSVVDHLGRESLPSYSDHIGRGDPGVKYTSLHNNGTAAGTLVNYGVTFSWESFSGLAHRVGIGDVADGDSFQIYGKDWYGRDINESLNTDSSGYTYGSDTVLESINYYSEVTGIVSKLAIENTTLWIGNAGHVVFHVFDEDLDNNLVSFNAPSTESEAGYRFTYRVYKSTGGRFGLIGETENLYFHDYGVAPDYTETPMFQYDPFSITAPPGVSDYDSVLWSPSKAKKADHAKVPYAVGQYQQRLLFGRTDKDPERTWVSAIGQYNNFNPRATLKDDTSFSFSLAGQTRGAIQHYVTLGKLLVFTDVGEWVIGGAESSALTPTQINAQQIGYAGTGKLAPLMAGQDIIFVQPRGNIVRDLGWKMDGSGYTGNDLTVFSGHIFRNKQIVDWDYQQNPESIVWACMADGSLVAMSYLKEHQIIAWHRHHLGGALQYAGTRPQVESIATIPEGSGSTRRDATYMVVRRYAVDGYVRYIERMSDYYEPTYLNYKLCDAHYAFNGWLDEDTPESQRSTTVTITEDSGSGYEYPVTVTMTASTSYFSDISVSDEIHFGEPGDVDVKVTITSISSSTVALGTINNDVPAALQDSASYRWGYAPYLINQLHHLNEKDVAVVGDGAVLASPFNSDYDTVTVGGATGSFVMPVPSCIVAVGLPYSSNLQTLNIDSVEGETLADKKKLVSSVTAHLEKSKGGFYGIDSDSEDSITGLYEMQYNSVQEYQDTNDLYTGLNEIVLESDWSNGGSLYIRQVDPLPMSILSLHPRLNITKRGMRGD